ncbi:HAD-IIB family hydrolase [Marimonas lutisalis]|uniref:HAD-IIB family hydrolase n=1 Tax=Marimonas lutisalis TaxID=2545756 RepID=UPI0010F5AE12|nr:HAD-IIB family hydrolase [Marimonas lutisalis]
MTKPSQILVFSDLDGTLLDHHTYSWAPANGVLARMRKQGIGLILATSKTASEVAPIRSDIGFSDWPAIVENGGGILEPQTSEKQSQTQYFAIRKLLRNLPNGFVGFGDMSAQHVAEITGLTLEAAARAKERAFSEPGVWTGTPEDLETFTQAAEIAGLELRHGGRFLSVSFGATKAEQMDLLIKRFKPKVTIALGDAPNDIEMLQKADFGVIVANNATPELPPMPGETTGRTTRTHLEGPEGWAVAVSDLLDKHAPIEETRTHG